MIGPCPKVGCPPILQSYQKESPVVVRADRVTLLERFVSIVDEIRSLGLHLVSLEVVKLWGLSLVSDLIMPQL